MIKKFIERFYWITLIIFLFFLSNVAHSADSTVNYKNQPPSTAVSPSLSIGSGADVCIVTRSAGVQTSFIGLSGGGHVRDLNCERIKLSRAMAQLGLKVSAAALLCQDTRIFEAMTMAGSPCPYLGKTGPEATKEWIKIGRLNEDGTINKSWSDADVFSVGRKYGQPVK